MRLPEAEESNGEMTGEMSVGIELHLKERKTILWWFHDGVATAVQFSTEYFKDLERTFSIFTLRR